MVMYRAGKHSAGRELVAPVQALETELKTAAEALLSEAQLAAGPVPEPMTPIRDINLEIRRLNLAAYAPLVPHRNLRRDGGPEL
jgi:hypothetical protein